MTLEQYNSMVFKKIVSLAEPRKIEVCGICGCETMQLPPDSISFCKDCDSVVEGNTNVVEVENE